MEGPRRRSVRRRSSHRSLSTSRQSRTPSTRLKNNTRSRNTLLPRLCIYAVIALLLGCACAAVLFAFARDDATNKLDLVQRVTHLRARLTDNETPALDSFGIRGKAPNRVQAPTWEEASSSCFRAISRIRHEKSMLTPTGIVYADNLYQQAEELIRGGHEIRWRTITESNPGPFVRLARWGEKYIQDDGQLSPTIKWSHVGEGRTYVNQYIRVVGNVLTKLQDCEEKAAALKQLLSRIEDNAAHLEGSINGGERHEVFHPLLRELRSAMEIFEDFRDRYSREVRSFQEKMAEIHPPPVNGKDINITEAYHRAVKTLKRHREFQGCIGPVLDHDLTDSADSHPFWNPW
jgi:hypothetical protein